MHLSAGTCFFLNYFLYFSMYLCDDILYTSVEEVMLISFCFYSGIIDAPHLCAK